MDATIERAPSPAVASTVSAVNVRFIDDLLPNGQNDRASADLDNKGFGVSEFPPMPGGF